jgi:lipoprotein LpqH
LLVKHGLILAALGAATVASLVGCSSHQSNSQTSGPAGKVTFGSNDAGPVTSVSCETKDGLTTITAEGSLRTTVVVTEGAAPQVKTVNIGDIQSDGAALMYIEGVSGAPVVVSRDGKSYTVTGNGLASDAANQGNPVDTPFDIALTCP